MAIQLKTAAEIEKIRTASQIAAAALDEVTKHIKVGITTEEIDQIAADFIKSKGAVSGALGYKGYPKHLCTSINHQVCHGIPGDKKLKNGDIVNVDIVVEKDGWYGDTSKMFVVGEGSVLANRLVEVTRDCMIAGIKVVRPGATLGDVGAAIAEIAHGNRFSIVREFCGHGIGESMHEEPQVVHYGKPGEGEVLQEGMVFTIEPMINAGKRHIKTLPDGWTVVTKDRSLSAQWEHTIVVTKDGYDVLSKRPDEKDL